MDTIKFKNRNWQITDFEVWDKQVFFSIDLGKYGKLLFIGEVHFNVNNSVDCEFESVEILLDKYDLDSECGYHSGKFLNKRNTIFICERIEEIISKDPEHYGFDYEDYYESEEDNKLFWAELD